MNFLKTDEFGKYNGALYWIKSSSAKSIATFSNFPSEAESILLPATKLKVISKQLLPTYKGTVYEIHMEEIEANSDGKYTTLF